MEKPLVSVIMPVYNGEKYIGKAIESVLAQNVPIELLVIDDCSTDKTELTVMKYMDSGNIRYIRNKENMGAARSRNRGVKASKGKYIAFLDADDWWEKGKLEAQVKTMELTGCDICSTGRELMQPNGHTTGKYIPVKERITYHDLLKHNSINCSSVLLKREDALAFPMTHDDSHEDYITWLKIPAQRRGKIQKQTEICRNDLSGVSLCRIWTSEKPALFYFLCSSRSMEIPLKTGITGKKISSCIVLEMENNCGKY